MNGGKNYADQRDDHQDNIQQTHDNLCWVIINLKKRKGTYKQQHRIQNNKSRSEHVVENIFYYPVHELTFYGIDKLFLADHCRNRLTQLLFVGLFLQRSD